MVIFFAVAGFVYSLSYSNEPFCYEMKEVLHLLPVSEMREILVAELPKVCLLYAKVQIWFFHHLCFSLSVSSLRSPLDEFFPFHFFRLCLYHMLVLKRLNFVLTQRGQEAKICKRGIIYSFQVMIVIGYWSINKTFFILCFWHISLCLSLVQHNEPVCNAFLYNIIYERW